MEVFNYEIKINNSPIKINMEQFSDKKNSDLSITFEDIPTSEMFYDWFNQLQSDNTFDKLEIRVLKKRYPYKSKKKRHIKKWWDKHSEMKVYENVKIDTYFKE